MGLFHTPALFFRLARTPERQMIQGAIALSCYRRLSETYLGMSDEVGSAEVEERLSRGWEAVRQLESAAAPGLAVLMEALLPPVLAIDAQEWLLAPAEAIQFRSRTAHYVLWYFAPCQVLAPMLLSPQDSAFAETRSLTGARDVQVGDAELDSTTVIQSSNPEGLQRWLSQDAVRQALRRLRAATPRWRVNHRGAGAVIGAEDLKPSRFEGLLRDLQHLVRQFPTA